MAEASIRSAGNGGFITINQERRSTMSTIHTNRNAKISADQKMIDGIQKFLMQFASLPVGSQTVTPAEIVKVFQDRLDPGKALLAPQAARTTTPTAPQAHPLTPT